MPNAQNLWLTVSSQQWKKVVPVYWKPNDVIRDSPTEQVPQIHLGLTDFFILLLRVLPTEGVSLLNISIKFSYFH